MKFKFNVGDKVKFVGNWSKVDEDSFLRDYGYVTIKKQLNLLGHPFYEIVEDDSEDAYNEKALELVKEAENVKLKYTKPTKDELLDMPKGTKIFTDAKKDNEFVYDGNTFCSENTLLYPSYLKYDLTINPTRKDKYGTRITKIEKPTYETVYENDFITDLIKDIKYYYEENDWLLKKNKALEEIVSELQEKLKQANIDVDISKQESNIADIFFNEED